MPFRKDREVTLQIPTLTFTIMTLYTQESKLCDIIFRSPEVITVINRFGIYLGVGDKTVGSICDAHGVDAPFFLSIINTYLNEDYFPENILRSVRMDMLVDYLKKTDMYYEQFQLPNIERHFNSLVSHSRSENSNLHLLRKFFIQMKGELLAVIRQDWEETFPTLLRLHECGVTTAEDVGICERMAEEDRHPVEDKLADLLSFFIIHLQGEYDINLCRAVVSAIFTLDRDIKQNNRIRSRILRPLAAAMGSNFSV